MKNKNEIIGTDANEFLLDLKNNNSSKLTQSSSTPVYEVNSNNDTIPIAVVKPSPRKIKQSSVNKTKENFNNIEVNIKEPIITEQKETSDEKENQLTAAQLMRIAAEQDALEQFVQNEQGIIPEEFEDDRFTNPNIPIDKENMYINMSTTNTNNQIDEPFVIENNHQPTE